PLEEPIPDAFELLGVSLAGLESHERPAVALVWAEMKLLDLSGFLPEFGRCVVTERTVMEGQPFLSPSAGGYVSDGAANEFVDRFRSRAEVLYGLERVTALAAPPTNFKFVEEAL